MFIPICMSIWVGPAGLSAGLALTRVCRYSIVFDSEEYRDHGTEEMRKFLSRDGISPESFPSITRQQIEERYPSGIQGLLRS
jgi:hypothetical protein